MGVELAVAAQVAGAVLGASSAFSSAQASKNAAEYQAQIQRNNATIAEWQAEDAIRRGQDASQKAQLNTASLKGRQRAAMAERGIDLGEGSALNLLTDTDMFGKIDSNTAIDNSKREAWAYREQGKGSLSNAALLQYKADSTNPYMSSAGSLLTGAGQVASSWYSFSEKGKHPFGVDATKW